MYVTSQRPSATGGSVAMRAPGARARNAPSAGGMPSTSSAGAHSAMAMFWSKCADSR